MNSRHTALGLLNYAACYITAASHLVSEIDDNKLQLRFDAPINLLTGHGFEILLKSFLRSKNCSEEELRGWGHNLETLLIEAQQRGLTIHPSTDEIGHVQLLNKQFGQQPYRIRYLETGSSTAHDDRIVIKLAQKIEAAIRPDIEANYQL